MALPYFGQGMGISLPTDTIVQWQYTCAMKQTMLLKLAPTQDQHHALLETMHAFNAAATYVAEIAFGEKTANKFELQKLVYGELRTTYKLPAQLAIRAISKASEAYKRNKSLQPTFRAEGAIVYDPRVMAFKGLSTVSLITLSGRVLVPFLVGGYQQARLDRIQGQADLLYRHGAFFLAVTLDAPAPAPAIPTGILGVDLGIVNLATDSEGETFRGEAVERNRKRHAALRQRLQKRGTKNAKRHLKKLSGQQARFKKNTNHVISKRIVHKAKAKGQEIAIEDLRHIRTRTERTVSRSQRSRHSSWAFGQLRLFLSYKAALAGVPLHIVDPRNTSKTCHVCGHCAKENRKSQASFCCVQCGYSDNADRNAAINISRASVMVPIAAGRA
ncbi:MAG TPA: transposase [Ktedonobacteraceae bacterium]|nr:transposase [Ktedonobacteraceae bacterium]